ncbi:hypothetical protein LEP1GSC073_3763 [Leptospira noguchii str. Cascata]|nr:hypothetical protein LEP1GSC072_0367 [Leptospira noguchii str. Bonito]EMS82677.1 hypothetical protein LEP1GSC073_3763 [Leptospira noguchii str. Cascata]
MKLTIKLYTNYYKFDFKLEFYILPHTTRKKFKTDRIRKETPSYNITSI